MSSQEPTKTDVDTILKRLRALAANKVFKIFKINFYFFKFLNFFRVVLTAEPKIQHGHQLLMVFLFALIVQPHIDLLVYTFRLSSQLN